MAFCCPIKGRQKAIHRFLKKWSRASHDETMHRQYITTQWFEAKLLARCRKPQPQRSSRRSRKRPETPVLASRGSARPWRRLCGIGGTPAAATAVLHRLAAVRPLTWCLKVRVFVLLVWRTYISSMTQMMSKGVSLLQLQLVDTFYAGSLPPTGAQQPAPLWNARADPKANANRERDIRRLHKWRRMLGASCSRSSSAGRCCMYSDQDLHEVLHVGQHKHLAQLRGSRHCTLTFRQSVCRLGWDRLEGVCEGAPTQGAEAGAKGHPRPATGPRVAAAVRRPRPGAPQRR